MAAINVDKLSLKDLIELEGKVKKAISVAKEREAKELRQKISEMAEGSGFSVNELFGSTRPARGSSKSTQAKFVNPDNRSETWTGRGRKPNWLVAKLGKGAKMADFAV